MINAFIYISTSIQYTETAVGTTQYIQLNQSYFHVEVLKVQ